MINHTNSKHTKAGGVRLISDKNKFVNEEMLIQLSRDIYNGFGQVIFEMLPRTEEPKSNLNK